MRSRTQIQIPMIAQFVALAIIFIAMRIAYTILYTVCVFRTRIYRVYCTVRNKYIALLKLHITQMSKNIMEHAELKRFTFDRIRRDEVVKKDEKAQTLSLSLSLTQHVYTQTLYWHFNFNALAIHLCILIPTVRIIILYY